MFKKIYLAVFAITMAMFTSCNSDGEPGGYMQGVFTVQNSIGSPVLWMDGGPVVYPSVTAAQQLMANKNFASAERVLLVVTYKDADVTGDSSTSLIVKNAEVAQGSVVPTSVIRTPEMAEADMKFNNYLADDSISTFYDISRENGIWFYKGYMTAQFSSTFYVEGQTGILPTVLATYTVDESNPSEVSVTLYLNKHKKSGATEGSQVASFVSSFSLADMQQHVMRNSLSEVNITINFATKEGKQQLKKTIKREDFFKPF